MEKATETATITNLVAHPCTSGRQPPSSSSKQPVSMYLQEFLARKQVTPSREPPLFTFDVLSLAFFRSYFGVSLYDQLVALLKGFNESRIQANADTKLKGHMIRQFGDTAPEVLEVLDCFLPAELHFFQNSGQQQEKTFK